MRAVKYDAFGEAPRVAGVPAPKPPAGGVVVTVHATGMCRSDWHAWAGHDDVALPHIPGHELAGVIAEVGAGVRRWQVGDRVTAPFVCGCGHCEWCRSGDAQVCPNQQQPGFTHWGSFAEQVALHAADTNLIAVPDSVSDTTAAALGCRFATAYRALVGRARLRQGEWLTVIGAGGVGLSAVMIGVALGARVIAVDRHEGALNAAQAVGAQDVLRSSEVDVPAIIHDLTGGGSHVALDAVGTDSACADSVLSLRRRGRHVQVGLVTGGTSPVPMGRAIAWELDVLGSHGMAASDYPELLDLVTRGDLRPQDLIERTIGLEEAAALLPMFDRATVSGMTMVDPRSQS